MRNYWSGVTRRRDALRQVRSLADGLLFVRILLFALAMPTLLRLRFAKLQSLLEPKSACPTPEPAKIEKIINYVDAVLTIGKPLVGRGCLTRGLALYYFLRRAGLDVTVCFGMGNADGEFLGHCWLAKDGEPFLESQDPRPLYTTVYSIPCALPTSGDLLQVQ